jgi:hypothetical protein
MNPVNTSDSSLMDTYQQRLNHGGNSPARRSAQQQRVAANQIEQALLEQHARSRLDMFSQQLLRDESVNQSQSFPNSASANLHDLGMSHPGAYQASLPSWLQQSRQADTIAQLLGQRQQQQQHHPEETPSFAASNSSSTFESARRLEELKQLQAALQRQTGTGMGAGGLFPSLAAGGHGGGFDQISPAAELLLAKQQQQQELLCRPLMDLYSSSGEVSGTISRQQQQQQQQGYIADPFGADRKRSATEEMNDSDKKLSSLSPPSKRKKKRLTPKGNSWSLPAVRGVKAISSSAVPGVHNISNNNPMKLLSFSKCWHKLSDGDMRVEIFRRKLHRGEVPITGKTKSAILLSQRNR